MRGVADLDLCYLQAGGLEAVIAFIERCIAQAQQFSHQGWDRVLRTVGIGDMPLSAKYRKPAIDAAAAAHFHHIAQPGNTGWLADQAVVNFFARLFQPFQYLPCAIYGVGFLVAGDH